MAVGIKNNRLDKRLLRILPHGEIKFLLIEHANEISTPLKILKFIPKSLF